MNSLESHKKLQKKSQIALEFVLLFGLSMFIAIGILIFVYQANTDKAEEKIIYKMKDFSYTIQSEFVLASEMNNGYNRVVVLPEKVAETDYNITITGNMLVVSFEDIEYYYKIPYVIGNITKGDNTLIKKDDTLYINQ